MTNAVESHAAGEAGQRLALRRPAEDGLTVVLAGRWCLDETLPSQEAIERELSAALRGIGRSGAGVGRHADRLDAHAVVVVLNRDRFGRCQRAK